ncbi:MAG: T9SS type A sorting domain-containing protein, partial [Saprospiraceae bacterium]
KILWSAEDGCGNWSHCEYLIRLEDCKQPSPVCINGLSTVVMPIGGQVTVWAKDFNASSFDDCTPGADLLYSFSGDVYQPSFTYTCDNVPAFGVELSVNIWVADGGTDDNCNGQVSWTERNKDYCSTTIVITDNANVCDTSGSVLAGQILTDHGVPVGQVKVTLTSPGQVFPAYITSADGHYRFDHLLSGTNYTITPERDDNHKNGVSTLDLVRIQKHLLGLQDFTSPYQFIAADANNSSSVSAIDLVELRKLILGIYPALPSSESWTFVDKKFTMPNPAHPWPYEGTIDIEALQGRILDNDFVGVKVGDVNNSVQANATQVLPRDGRRVMNIKVASQESVEAGDMVEMKMTLPNEVSGFQWTLETDGLEYVGLSSEDINIGDDNIGILGNGIVTMSWNGIQLNHSADVGPSIIMRWKVTTAGKISKMVRMTSHVTPAESYTVSDEIMDVKLSYLNDQAKAEFGLYQNKPNPWNGQTLIGFDLPKDDHARLTIFDVAGKTLKTIEGDYKAGYNSIELTEKDIPASGVLYYRLESGENSASKKMIILR